MKRTEQHNRQRYEEFTIIDLLLTREEYSPITFRDLMVIFIVIAFFMWLGCRSYKYQPALKNTEQISIGKKFNEY